MKEYLLILVNSLAFFLLTFGRSSSLLKVAGTVTLAISLFLCVYLFTKKDTLGKWGRYSLMTYFILDVAWFIIQAVQTFQ